MKRKSSSQRGKCGEEAGGGALQRKSIINENNESESGVSVSEMAAISENGKRRRKC